MDEVPVYTTDSKLTDWVKEPTVSILKRDLEAARSSHDAQMGRIQKWKRLIEAPRVKHNGKHRSGVQPKLIRKQAEWRYPALSEPFLNSSKLFKVSPITFEDVEAAKQNELILNWQFRTKMNKVRFIDNFVRSVVDEGTCIVQLGWDRQTRIDNVMVPVWEHYPIEDEEQLEQFMQFVQFKQANPRGYNEQVDEATKAAVSLFEEQQIATIAMQVGEEEAQEEVILVNEPTVTVLDPDNVYIDPSCNGDPDKALFIIVAFTTNKAELLKNTDRYKNIDKINWESVNTTDSADYTDNDTSNFTFQDSSRRKTVAYEMWSYYDIEGNGELVPIVSTWIGDTMIRMEHNPFPDGKLPFVIATYSPVKREVYGEPDAELLEDNQKILGAVTRGVIDLLGKSANSQIGISKGLLDPLNKRRFADNQVYEFNPGTPSSERFIEHRYPEIPNSAITMMSLQNNEAEAITGVKSFSGGLSGNAYGDVATGIRGMLDAASKREMSILRRLASAVNSIGSKILAMNAVFLSEEETIRVTNSQFITIQREDLEGNFDLEVDISTAEVDDAKSQDLSFLLQTIGPQVDPSITMRILADIAELKHMPDLAEDLRNYQPPEPSEIEVRIQELELAKLEAEVARLQAEAGLAQSKSRKQDMDSAKSEADLMQEISGTKHAREIEKQKAQARGNQDLQVTKALADINIESAIGFNELTKQ